MQIYFTETNAAREPGRLFFFFNVTDLSFSVCSVLKLD